jgi:hypothetical protein
MINATPRADGTWYWLSHTASALVFRIFSSCITHGSMMIFAHSGGTALPISFVWFFLDSFNSALVKYLGGNVLIRLSSSGSRNLILTSKSSKPSAKAVTRAFLLLLAVIVFNGSAIAWFWLSCFPEEE